MGEQEVRSELPVKKSLMAPNGFLGKTTQVWDAVVTHKESGKTIALFRCTQMVLYAKPGSWHGRSTQRSRGARAAR